MKRIIICLSIAGLSVMGLHAQDRSQIQQTPEYKAYMQKQEQDLQSAIRTQTQQYTSEAAKRMETRKREVQNDLEARRARLTNRPTGMVKYSGN